MARQKLEMGKRVGEEGGRGWKRAAKVLGTHNRGDSWRAGRIVVSWQAGVSLDQDLLCFTVIIQGPHKRAGAALAR